MDGGFRIIERGLEAQASEPSVLTPQPVASPAGSSGPHRSREMSFSTVAADAPNVGKLYPPSGAMAAHSESAASRGDMAPEREDAVALAQTAAFGGVTVATSINRIGKVTFELTDRQGAVHKMATAIRARSCGIFAFCNMHTFNLARRSPALASALSKATIFNDGLGIDVARRMLFGAPFPDNLNGTDLTPALLASLDRPTSVFILGSQPGVADEAARQLERRFPLVTVVGRQHGYFDRNESGQIADRIRAAQTDLVLVGMGNPQQELWAAEMAARTGAVILCVGAFLDFVSGRIPRAPRFVRTIRCEWLYRLALEPMRLSRRYLGGSVPFLWAVSRERLQRRASGKLTPANCRN